MEEDSQPSAAKHNVTSGRSGEFRSLKIQEYYNKLFRQDLAALLQGIPAPEARIVTLGYDWVSRCSLLERVPLDHRANFLVCLHFTVLVDQAMNYHFLHNYTEFEKLTLYPKFRLGLGHPAYLNPIRIFEDPIRCNLINPSEIRLLISDGMQLFVAETDDFFKRHMPRISAKDFFTHILTDSDIAPVFHGGLDNSESLPLGHLVAFELRKTVSGYPFV